METDLSVEIKSESVSETPIQSNLSVSGKREADGNEEDSVHECKKVKLEDENGENVSEEKLIDENQPQLLYNYIKPGEFTCEIYKMELGNLPKFVSYTCVKKLIEKKSSVVPHKLKVIKTKAGKTFAFVSFKSAEERDKAIEAVNGVEWKHRKLSAKKANPAQDPYLKRMMETEKSNQPCEFAWKEASSTEDKLNDKVCPLWKTPYEEQLKSKSEKYSKFLFHLRKDVAKKPEGDSEIKFNTSKWAYDLADTYNGCICPLDEIKPSPVTFGYRNKCEFSVGPEKTVGFRLGLYKEGSVSVVFPPENCPLVSPKMRNIISTFQEYLTGSEYPEYDNVTREGFWRQITVRATELGAMAIIAVNHQGILDNDLDAEKEKIVRFFTANRDKCNITSLFFHPFVTRNKTAHDSSELQLIDGEPFIYESMRGNELKMKISPFSFWQTNTKAAEVCYSTIEELAGLNENSVVLDICCGTGSIGIFLASKVKHVIGLELNPDAVKAAHENAVNNQITNIEFIEGKAEDVIDSVLKIAFKKFGDQIDLTAIIDPPRAGLHGSVIKTIRGTSNIKKLIYVSCEPNLAKKNLIDLSRPQSNAYKGIPFVPTRAIPVDMFPHTDHCELLLLYQRFNTIESQPMTPPN